MNFFQKNIFPFIEALLINVLITFPVLCIAIYTNPATYHGSEGNNIGLIVLVITTPVWLLICNWHRKHSPRETYQAYVANACLNFVVFFVATLVHVFG